MTAERRPPIDDGRPPGSRLYRRLLLLYPPPFRRAWGEEMTDLATALLQRARARAGLGGVLRLWLRLLGDLALGAAAERRRAARYRSHPPHQRRSRGTIQMLDGIGNDLRGALRALRRYPAHATAVILTLGLGIGVTTAIFSVVRAVLLEPLPYREPGRLVLLSESNPERGWTQAQVAPANFFDWSERTRSFAGMAGFSDFLSQSIATGGPRPERVRAMGVAGDLFGVLGTPPALGRSFRSDETWSGGPPVVILSHAYWQKHFDGSPAAVGRPLLLGGRPHTVVGVMPPGFSLWSKDVDLWTPFGWDRADRTATWFRRAHIFRVVARLAPGVTLERADAELRGLAGQLEKEHPETNTLMGAGATPLDDWLLGPARLSRRGPRQPGARGAVLPQREPDRPPDLLRSLPGRELDVAHHRRGGRRRAPGRPQPASPAGDLRPPRPGHHPQVLPGRSQHAAPGGLAAAAAIGP